MLPQTDYEAMVREMYRAMDSTEVLEKCLEHIQKGGWYKGALEGPGGTVCLLGGLNRACGKGAQQQPEYGDRHYDSFMEAAKALGAVLADMAELEGGDPDSVKRLRAGDIGTVLHVIPQFNDNDRTTYEDVTLVLKRAIEHSKENDA